MTIWRRIAPILLCALASAPNLALCAEPASTDKSGGLSEPSTESLSTTSGVRAQVYPAAWLSGLFPSAVQISFAVAVVPDPLVPRYRRPYDLDIVALELGMLHEGYVLDRFYLPWNDELRSDELRAASFSTSSSQQQSQSLLQQPPMRYRYGLMIFRCDGWRSREELHTANSVAAIGTGSACSAPVSESSTRGARIRALYLVTDTAAKGIESDALLCAIDRINSQLPAGTSDGASPLQRFPRCWRWPQASAGTSITSDASVTSLGSGSAASEGSPAPHTALLSYPGACQSPDPSSTLLVLGPNFSGAVDSAGEAGKRLQMTLGKDLSTQPIKAMCLLSSSATDSTNRQANDIWSNAPFQVKYDSLALENDRKLRHLAHLLPTLIGKRPAMDSLAAESSEAKPPQPSPVAILAEASTYGYGVCGYADDPGHPMPSEVRHLCLSARRLYFPANIADIRYGMQQDQQRRTLSNPLKLQMPTGHLSLDLGAENGSEYPESRQSALTSVGMQLALEQVLEQLQEDPPKLVIVVATDVRDRLFLFDELRKRLARAMLVDLESDNLIGHPDFLNASRGALAIGSALLKTQGSTYGCEEPLASEGSATLASARSRNAAHAPSPTMSTWSTDFQAILSDAVSRLYDPASERSRLPCDAASFQSRQPVLQIISREGLKIITSIRSDPGPGRDQSDRRKSPGLRSGAANLTADQSSPSDAGVETLDGGRSRPGRGLLASAEISAPFFCLSTAWLFIGPLVLAHRRPQHPTPRAISLTNSAVGGFCLLYPFIAFFVTRSLHLRDHDNVIFLVTIIVLCAALVGLVTCIRLLRQATRAAPPANLRNVVAPALLALCAAGFATTPSVWYASIRNSVADYLDVSALEDIALDPDPGLAFLLLVAVATLALLYSSVVLATSSGIVNRNSAVLREDRAEVAMAARALSTALDQPETAAPPPVAAIPSMDATGAVLSMPLTSSVEPAQMAQTVLPRPVALPSPAPRLLLASRALPTIHFQPPKRELRGILNLNPFGVLAIGALAILAFVLPHLLWGDIRLTVFGPLASRVALLALTATSVSATVLLACSLGMARRISALSRYLATARKRSCKDGLHEVPDKLLRDSREVREDAVGRWPPDVNGPRIFPPTPVVARAADGGAAAKQLLQAADLSQWRERVSEWLHHGLNDGARRAAIFALLATEISVFRWCVLGTVLCALGSVAAVYLFPIEADPLLLFNLLLLIAIGAVAGLGATTFERDPLLSNVLCNRPAPRKFSTPLFVFISVPFIALAAAVAIVQLPGVLDWGGGVLQLLGALRLHS